MEKNSFVLYTDYFEHIEDLTDEEAGQLLKCIFLYAMGEEIECDNRVVSMALSFITKQMDKDKAKYEETCIKRREAGLRGGRPKANGLDEKAKKPNGFSEKQTEAKKPDNDNEYDNDNENDIKEKNIKKKSQAFHPPTLDEVKAYIQEKGYTVDAQRFVDFYESKGWMVGKNKMKDWKACVRTWASNDKKDQRSGDRQVNQKVHNFNERSYDYTALASELIKRG